MSGEQIIGHISPEEQLLICGFDVDKQARRTYTVKDISDIRLI